MVTPTFSEPRKLLDFVITEGPALDPADLDSVRKQGAANEVGQALDTYLLSAQVVGETPAHVLAAIKTNIELINDSDAYDDVADWVGALPY